MLVAYFRVSTKKQGQSGLGLEAQQDSVRRYAAATGQPIMKEYVEVESGKKCDRVELAKAIAYCKAMNATLVIAKLDRLARNVAFVSKLMESGVSFVCCDNPMANRLTIHILASIAEHEAEMISQRTKAALAAYKARGGKLGSQDPRCQKYSAARLKEIGPKGGAVLTKRAQDYRVVVQPIIQQLLDEGKNYRQVAEELNGRGMRTQTGKEWNLKLVHMVMRPTRSMAAAST